MVPKSLLNCAAAELFIIKLLDLIVDWKGVKIEFGSLDFFKHVIQKRIWDIKLYYFSAFCG